MNTCPPALRRGAALAAAVLIASTAACGTVTAEGASSSAEQAGYPFTVENCGRKVTIPKAPRRVVSMHPSITELMIQLGLGDKVVAQAQDALGEPSPDLAKQVDAIPSISKDTPPNREVLLAQRPDLVLSGTEYEFSTDQGFAGYADLAAAGAQSFVATAGCKARRSAGTVEDTFTDLAFLGKAFGVQDRAARLEKDARAQLAQVAAIVGDDAPVRAAQIYVEGGKLYAIGGAVEIDVLRLGGGKNVFAGDGRFDDFYAAEVNPEVVLDKAPDALVFAVNSPEHEAETRAYIAKHLADTPAAKAGRLVAVDNTFVQPGTLSAIEGARVVAEGLHR
jgi:iron complex transport system substrate-binding protein